MIFSLYPTYTDDENNKILEEAKKNGVDTFFVSLHLKEGSDLNLFLNYLESVRREEEFFFHGDISPVTLEIIKIRLNEVEHLKEYGLKGVRLDYGFTEEEMRYISNMGFEVSFNGSTLTREEVEKFKDIDFISWHNFYPREETGISNEFLRSQNRMFKENSIRNYAFIKGDTLLRAPLYKGLPTLESQRHQSSYLSYLELKLKYGVDEVVLAEGTIDDKDMRWIMRYEKEGIITLPLESLDKRCEFLLDEGYKIRIEETDYSMRVEGSRGKVSIDDEKLEERKVGDLFIDTVGYGRYKGEVHIIKDNLPPLLNTYKIGKLKKGYEGLGRLKLNNSDIIFEI